MTVYSVIQQQKQSADFECVTVSALQNQANAGNYAGTAKFIVKYKTDHGNARRRRQEAAMFKEGNYDASH